MKQLLFLLLFLPSLLYSQSEGGFGFRRFANKTALDAVSVSNTDKSASRRAYVHSTGLYYRWTGSTWINEVGIDTLTYTNDTLRVSLLNDGVPAKLVRIVSSGGGDGLVDTVRTMDSLRIYNGTAVLVFLKEQPQTGWFLRLDNAVVDDGGIYINGTNDWVRYVEDLSRVNVKWFGAVGDSLTNDNTAIQAALTYSIVDSIPGSILYFPAGRYSYTSVIYAYKPVNFSIQGDAMSNTYLFPRGCVGISIKTDSVTYQTDPFYGAAEARDFEIKNISVIATGTQPTRPVGVKMWGGFNVKFENFRVEEFYNGSGFGTGISLNNPIPGDIDAVQHTTFDNVWVAECDTGIVTRLHNTMLWQDVKVDQCNKIGVVLRNGVYWNKGMVQGSQNCGIWIDNSNPFVIKGIHLTDLHIEGNAYTAPKYGSIYKPDAVDMNNLVIENCYLSSPGASKLFNLRRVQGANITFNTYAGNAITDTISLTSVYNSQIGRDNFTSLKLVTSDCAVTWLNGDPASVATLSGLTIGKDSPGRNYLNVGGDTGTDGVLGIGTQIPLAQLHVTTGDIQDTSIVRLQNTTGFTQLFRNTATPEGDIAGNPGDFAYTSISSAGRWWGKATGTGNTGWVEFYNTSNAPVVTITGGGINVVTGSFPNFTITGTEVDGSITNELQTYGHSGTTSYTNTLSNGGGAFTLQSSGIVSISNTAGTVTVGAIEVDGSVTNELQTLSNTSTSTTHTVTLSNSGGSFQLAEGSGITLATSGTGLDGVITVSATGGGAANYQLFRDDGVDLAVQPNANFVSTSDIAFTLTNDAGNLETEVSADIPVNAVQYAEIQQVGAVKLLGNPTGSPADVSEITLATGLSFVGTALTPADASATNEIQQIDTFSISGAVISASLSSDGVPAKTLNITESVQDITGGMVTGNVETGIAVTYDDTNGTLDFVTADVSATNEIQQIDTFEIVSDVLRNSLSLDGVPFKSVSLSPYRQRLDTFEIVANVLRASLLNDNVPFSSVNLGSYLQTLSLDSGTIGNKERFHLSISGGNTIHFDVAKSIYTDNGSTISGGTNVVVNGNTLRLTSSGFFANPIMKKSLLSGTVGYYDRWIGNNDSLEVAYITDGFFINSIGGHLGIISTEKLNLQGDSINLTTIATSTAVKSITGLTSGSTLKKLVGAVEGDVIGWDATSSHWESKPITDYKVNIYTDNGTTDEAERTVTLLDDINFISSSGTADFYVESGATGGRLDVSVDSSRLYFTDGSGTNAVSSSATMVMLKTGTADQVTISTDKINLVDASGTVLDFEVKDDTRFKVDSLEDFAIGRWPTFPNAFEYAEKNRYGLMISDNTSSGKKTTISGMAYDRTSNSYITSDRGSYQLNVSNYLSSGTAEMVTGATPSSYYNYSTHPLEPYDNIEMGFRNQWVGIPKNKTQYAYIYQGGDITLSAPYDTAAITMWIGIPQITDTTASAKSTSGAKAVSKGRGWGVQSLFHRTSTQQIEHPFNWIKVTTGNVVADTLLDGINFYGRYAFENSAPSVTSGDTSLMAWVGTGSATTPIWIDKDQFGGGGGTNIYNSNGTTTNNTRTATILESIRFVGTADFGQQYPFQVHSTGNEPPIQLWKGNTDSVYLYQSDVEYHFGSSTQLVLESSTILTMQADSITASTLETKTKIQNIVGISNSGTLQQIEGTSGNQVLKWNTSGYWELGTAGATVADGDYGDITVSASGATWTIDAGVVSNSKLASGAGGIYKGSGTIASGATATMTASSTFRINYSGGNSAFLTDDVNNAASLFGQDGTYAFSADNTSAYMTGALSSTFSLGSTGGTILTASVANTNTVNTRETIITNSSGTAATGLGTGVLYQLETSTTDSQDAAELDIVWSDATHASRTGDFVFNTVASAAALTEVFRIGGTNYQLTATASVSNTNTSANRLVIKTNSSGTAAAGFGGNILFQGESSTTDNRDMIKLAAEWGVATDASRTAQFNVYGQWGAAPTTFVKLASFNTSLAATGNLDIGSTTAVRIFNAGITTATGFTVGNSSSALTLSSSGTTGAVALQCSNSTSASGQINIGNAQSYTVTSGAKDMTIFQSSFAPTSGTATYAALRNRTTVNQTGGANGITRGYFSDPVLTSVVDWRAIDLNENSTSAKGIYQSGSSTTNNFAGPTTFGSTTTSTSGLELEVVGEAEFGSQGAATLLNQTTHSSGQISTAGDAQASELVFRRQVTGESETELFLNGAATQAILPGTNRVWTGTAKCSGAVQAVGNGATIVVGDVVASWQPFTIKKVGSSTTLMTASVGTTVEGWIDTNMAGATFTISADDTNEALKITFTPPTLGGTTTVCNAVCTVQLNEAGF